MRSSPAWTQPVSATEPPWPGRLSRPTCGRMQTKETEEVFVLGRYSQAADSARGKTVPIGLGRKRDHHTVGREYRPDFEAPSREAAMGREAAWNIKEAGRPHLICHAAVPSDTITSSLPRVDLVTAGPACWHVHSPRTVGEKATEAAGVHRLPSDCWELSGQAISPPESPRQPLDHGRTPSFRPAPVGSAILRLQGIVSRGQVAGESWAEPPHRSARPPTCIERRQWRQSATIGYTCPLQLVLFSTSASSALT